MTCSRLMDALRGSEGDENELITESDGKFQERFTSKGEKINIFGCFNAIIIALSFPFKDDRFANITSHIFKCRKVIRFQSLHDKNVFFSWQKYTQRQLSGIATCTVIFKVKHMKTMRIKSSEF